MGLYREQGSTFLTSTSFNIKLDSGSYFSSNFTIADHWFSKFAELHKMWRFVKPCTSALFSFDKYTMKYKDNYKEQPSNIQRVSPCIALLAWGKLWTTTVTETDKPRSSNRAAEKHWGWNSFLKTCSSSSSAMFTAGNMTYMRKRKKERQAAKRAMARENVSLWNP